MILSLAALLLSQFCCSSGLENTGGAERREVTELAADLDDGESLRYAEGVLLSVEDVGVNLLLIKELSSNGNDTGEEEAVSTEKLP